MITTYKTITSPTQAEFKDKGSRFIAFAYPIRTLADVKKYLDPLKEEHHKARHWCYAYRLGVDGTQFRANDDGELSGSVGRPILRQIDGKIPEGSFVAFRLDWSKRWPSQDAMRNLDDQGIQYTPGWG